MMKLTLLLSLLSVLCFAAIAQKQIDSTALSVDFSALNYERSLPFCGIEVVDGRGDTSKLGYLLQKKLHHKLVCKDGLASTLNAYFATGLKANYSCTSSRKLLLVIKRFWISENEMTEHLATKSVMKGINFGVVVPPVSAKFEIYLKQMDQYFPLIRLDTFYFTPKLKTGQPLDPVAFEEMLIALEKIDFERAAGTGRRLSWQEIANRNKSIFEKPVLNSLTKQRGVFVTFRDFLSNKIQYSDFETEQDELTGQLFVNENGEKKLLTEFWGFCDGESYFINAGSGFSQLKQVGNTFEFQRHTFVLNYPGGSGGQVVSNYNSLDSRAIAIASNGLSKLISNSNKTGKEICIQQLDMETGKTY